MFCKKNNCIYLKTFSDVPYCPRVNCIYNNEMKTVIADEISQIYKKEFLQINDYKKIERLKKVYHSLESG